jgi:hypothetical protein
MAYYKITGMLSQRHPFHADPEPTPASTVEAAKAAIVASVPAQATEAASILKPLVFGPLFAGTISGFAAYELAKKFSIDKSKAKGLGLTLGIVTAFGQIMGNWLNGWVEKSRQS